MADGSTLDSDATQWSALPASGLQVVMLYYDEADPLSGRVYRRIMHGTDFYYLAQDPARTEDLSGFAQQDGQAPRVGTDIKQASDAKQGTLIPLPRYNAILASSMGDLRAPTRGLPNPNPGGGVLGFLKGLFA